MSDEIYHRPSWSRTSFPRYRRNGFDDSSKYSAVYQLGSRAASDYREGKSSSHSLAKSQTSKKSTKKNRIALNRRRLELLSQPKSRGELGTFPPPPAQSVPSQDPPAADAVNPARYREVTPRLLRLAEPKSSLSGHSPKSRQPLSAQALQRIQELAEPKKVLCPGPKDPFKVNPKALTATCTPRTEQLARPKKLIPSLMFSQLLQNYLSRVFLGNKK